jgi:hypothetical protein
MKIGTTLSFENAWWISRNIPLGTSRFRGPLVSAKDHPHRSRRRGLCCRWGHFGRRLGGGLGLFKLGERRFPFGASVT